MPVPSIKLCSTAAYLSCGTRTVMCWACIRPGMRIADIKGHTIHKEIEIETYKYQECGTCGFPVTQVSRRELCELCNPQLRPPPTSDPDEMEPANDH